MPKRKTVPYEREPVKICWHPYSLQELQSERFIRVVKGIIAEEMTLVQFVGSPRPLR